MPSSLRAVTADPAYCLPPAGAAGRRAAPGAVDAALHPRRLAQRHLDAVEPLSLGPARGAGGGAGGARRDLQHLRCLLHTSDAADDLLCVDPGGRRIIKKKKNKKTPDARSV